MDDFERKKKLVLKEKYFENFRRMSVCLSVQKKFPEF